MKELPQMFKPLATFVLLPAVAVCAAKFRSFDKFITSGTLQR
jgi:hypothetical protein